MANGGKVEQEVFAEAATSDHLPGNRTAKQINAAIFYYSEEANTENPPENILVLSAISTLM